MKKMIRTTVATVFALLLTGCASLSTVEGPAPVGLDGMACVGRVGKPLPDADAVPASDDLALKEAQAVSGKGGICAGKVFIAQRDVRVYRVWDASRSSPEFGRWWALDKPVGPRETYRQEVAICAAWSALDRLISCDIKTGSVLVIGTTQSVDCADGPIPKSAAKQVYLHNELPPGPLLVENCRDEGVWP